MEKAVRLPSISLDQPRSGRRLLSGLLVFGPLLLGCQRRPGEEQLGRVIYALPKVPAAQVPYKLDQLDEAEPVDRQKKDTKGP